MSKKEDKEKAMKEGIIAVGTITGVILNELNKEIDKEKNKKSFDFMKEMMGFVGSLSIGLGIKMVYGEVYKEEIQKSREEKEKAENEEKDRIEKSNAYVVAIFPQFSHIGVNGSHPSFLSAPDVS